MALPLASLLACATVNTSTYRPDYAYTFYKLAGAAYCPNVEAWTCKPCLASNQSLVSVVLLFNATTDTRAYVAAYNDRHTHDMSIVVSVTRAARLDPTPCLRLLTLIC